MSIVNTSVIQDRIMVEAKRAKIIGVYKRLIDLHQSIGDTNAVIGVKKQLDTYIKEHYVNKKR